MMKNVDSNGFWRLKNNPISKVGVFPYLGKQISDELEPEKIYYVYRPPEELFSKEAIDSFNENPVPLIDNHTMIGDGFTPAEQKGIHGVISNIHRENDQLVGDLAIYSDSMKRQIEGGKKDLSMGYFCTYDLQEGFYNGQHYDAIQRDLRSNHVALVDEGRCGRSVRVYDSWSFDCMFENTAFDDFKEDDHPRAKNGQFASKGEGGGGSGSSSETANKKSETASTKQTGSSNESGALTTQCCKKLQSRTQELKDSSYKKKLLDMDKDEAIKEIYKDKKLLDDEYHERLSEAYKRFWSKEDIDSREELEELQKSERDLKDTRWELGLNIYEHHAKKKADLLKTESGRKELLAEFEAIEKNFNDPKFIEKKLKEKPFENPHGTPLEFAVYTNIHTINQCVKANNAAHKKYHQWRIKHNGARNEQVENELEKIHDVAEAGNSALRAGKWQIKKQLWGKKSQDEGIKELTNTTSNSGLIASTDAWIDQSKLEELKKMIDKDKLNALKELVQLLESDSPVTDSEENKEAELLSLPDEEAKDEEVLEGEEKKEDEEIAKDEEEEKISDLVEKKVQDALDALDLNAIIEEKQELVAKVRPLVGDFNYSRMTNADIAKYACDHLELKASKKTAQDVLNCYLKIKGSKKMYLSEDSSSDNTDDIINKYMKGE